MIEAYTGLVGGGKTYSAVETMLRYMGSGGFVCSNINLKLDGCDCYTREEYGWALQDGQYLFLENDGSGAWQEQIPKGQRNGRVLVVIDEAAEWFDAMDHRSAQDGFMSWIRHSRKLYCDVIFIVQVLSQLNKRLRDQCQYVWRFKDMSTQRIPILGWKWPLSQIAASQIDPVLRVTLRNRLKMKDKRVFDCYDTTEMHHDHRVGDDRQLRFEGGEVDMSRGWKTSVVMLWLALSVFVYYGMFNPDEVHGKVVIHEVERRDSGSGSDSGEDRVVRFEKFGYAAADGKRKAYIGGVELIEGGEYEGYQVIMIRPRMIFLKRGEVFRVIKKGKKVLTSLED